MKKRVDACIDCGEPKQRGSQPLRQRCWPCSDQFYRWCNYAGSQVHAAIARGDMPKAAAFACTDCGGPARDYDHRDYTKPMDVQPVCRRCNFNRGPALFPKRWEERSAA